MNIIFGVMVALAMIGVFLMWLTHDSSQDSAEAWFIAGVVLCIVCTGIAASLAYGGGV